jgi:asparagine synthetase B (glutamine-hydrolysing)
MCSLMFSTKIPENIPYVNEFMSKRGPDKVNSIVLNGHFFLHNLLSITGSFTVQPLSSEDGNIVCLFNGEIYNFKDFGDYDNDAKCIIPLYKKYGKEFIKKLDGEFAIVIVDYSEKIIIVTTDTFGTKPLWLSTIDGFGVSTYKSGLTRSGFSNADKIKANTTLEFNLENLILKEVTNITKFNLEQYKNNFIDWNKAFSKSIAKRCGNLRKKMFIGLSSGYDSGAIACELAKQKIPFKCYSVIGSENRNILEKRWEYLKNSCEIDVLTISPEDRKISHDWLLKNTEEWKYTTRCSRSDYNERYLSLWDDNGSNSLSYVCHAAKFDISSKTVFISGGGADEIISDYGYKGVSKYQHSNFGGLFPEKLEDIFPWPSFFESTMESYLMKDEFVGGSYGLEVRYPFLDVQLVQEFLNLTCELKNSRYKSVLDNYLTINDFPFARDQKIGF